MMTAAPRPVSPDDGVTDPDTGPPALAGAERFLPPTPAEVGRAAALCFQDVHTDAEIAHQLGIVRRTLARWKKRADFAAAIAALQTWQELRGEGAARPWPLRSPPRDRDPEPAQTAYPGKP